MKSFLCAALEPLKRELLNEAQPMEALIHIETIQEEHIQSNPDGVDPGRYRQ